ncbi:SDR family oxidoreductase [Terriglobus sp.]|uniref:SDR family oxidoreductase n=1 Tax=Terriglobus sp. TaxID=1889013 RepID=UPI003B001C3C
MAGKLEGKVALVTGGSSGIGLATAKRFLQEGAFVYITGRRETELQTVAASLGENAKAVRADASKLADLDALYAQIQQEKGRVDVLFVNAGGGSFAPLDAITEQQFDDTFNTNVKGVVFTVQKALPLLPDGASIVLNGSVVSVKGDPAFSVYSATKAAVRSFARGWTSDLKDRRIRVNVVSPGPIDTPGLSGLAQNEEQRKALYDSLAARVPLGRVGDADEIAKAVVFLASDDASYVAGVELFVDGGTVQV